MIQQTRTPDVNTPLRTTAIERGIWGNNSIHVSEMPGVDDDHWFAAKVPFQNPEDTADIRYD